MGRLRPRSHDRENHHAEAELGPPQGDQPSEFQPRTRQRFAQAPAAARRLEFRRRPQPTRFSRFRLRKVPLIHHRSPTNASDTRPPLDTEFDVQRRPRSRSPSLPPVLRLAFLLQLGSANLRCRRRSNAEVSKLTVPEGPRLAILPPIRKLEHDTLHVFLARLFPAPAMPKNRGHASRTRLVVAP